MAVAQASLQSQRTVGAPRQCFTVADRRRFLGNVDRSMPWHAAISEIRREFVYGNLQQVLLNGCSEEGLSNPNSPLTIVDLSVDNHCDLISPSTNSMITDLIICKGHGTLGNETTKRS